MLTRRLGIGALALGIAAPFAGSPYRSTRGQLDIDATARAILDGSDHVSALQLAAWIKSRKVGLRVVDVRTSTEFENDAIPTAENIPVDRLSRAVFQPAETIVLYSEEGAHAGQAWVMLRALGVGNVYFIAGGLADWRDEVMNPVRASEATPQQAAEFAATAELSHYFGGSPRIALPGEVITPAHAQRETIRRRGC